MTTALSTVVEQSAFAKQNHGMAQLFADRLHNVFTENMSGIAVKEFGNTECYYRGLIEKISFTLPSGQTVVCEITTPKVKS